MRLRILGSKTFHEPFAIRIIPAQSDEYARVKRFRVAVPLEVPDDKKPTEVKTDGRTTDWLNVTLKGYLSTFKGTTEADRDGDVVLEGAFRDTIERFMKNPVLLVDHRNQVANVAGRFTKMKEDKTGLAFEAELSNSPAMADVRFKVVEGSLRASSMGGIFHFAEDGRSIFKVDLFEGSLVPVPANPDALFSVRALNDSERKFMKCAHLWTSYQAFLESEAG